MKDSERPSEPASTDSITSFPGAMTIPTLGSPLAMMAQQVLAGQSTCPQDRRIYVGGLPYGLTEEHIRLPFSAFGTITNIDMPKDGLTGRSKGFCFVEYATKESCDVARSTMDGFQLGGRTIKVGKSTVPGTAQIGTTVIGGMQNASMQKKIDEIRAQAAKIMAVKSSVDKPDAAELAPEVAQAVTNMMATASSVVDNRIYVGGVMEEVAPQHLKSLFDSFGEVNSVWLAPDTDNIGKHKGYGFIEFDNPASAVNAIQEMNGFDLCGKQLKVDKAHHPK